jgi:hypothetical protein
MKRTRLLAALLALPLVAFDCGGTEERPNPFGLGCTLHVGGAAPPEDLWCVAVAYDYSAFPEPELASTTWAFEIVAYRGMSEIGAGGGVFLNGRPTAGTTYSWDGSTASPAIASGGFDRYGGSMGAGTFGVTHAASTLGDGSFGEGRASLRFTHLPPADATDAALLDVHGTLTARLPSLTGGGDATLSASF